MDPYADSVSLWRVLATVFLPIPVILATILSTPAPRNVRDRVLWFVEKVKPVRQMNAEGLSLLPPPPMPPPTAEAPVAASRCWVLRSGDLS
jgi:hypothetical protein